MSAASTPYESQRHRVRIMEALETLRSGASKAIARRAVARAVHVTPDQLDNIRKGKRKDLDGSLSRRIDAAFVALAPKIIGDLQHELAMAHAGARSIDPRLVAQAEASKHALEALIAEAQRAGATMPCLPEERS